MNTQESYTKETYIKVTETFANYGMRKTSMDDLARVMGVSRQTLYNKFKTKDAIREWAVTGYTEGVLEAALREFEDENNSVGEAICEALDRWAGDSFPLWKLTPHGYEVLNFDTEALMQQKVSVSEVFETHLIQYLLEQKTAKTKQQAEEISFAIMIALKGAFTVCESSEDFSNSMRRVVKLLV